MYVFSLKGDRRCGIKDTSLFVMIRLFHCNSQNFIPFMIIIGSYLERRYKPWACTQSEPFSTAHWRLRQVRGTRQQELFKS